MLHNHGMGAFGFIPFILLLAGLGFTRIRIQWVTAFVFLITLILASFVWKAPIANLWAGCLEGFITALVPIIWVILAAVLSYLVSVETGAMKLIQGFLSRITPDRRIQAVLIAFCFGGFLEAVAGFGTAVAIPTAMLISIGIAPFQAATMSLVANSVPVAFGALGIPIVALAKVTELNLADLTTLIALQLLPFSILVPVAIAGITQGSLRGLRSVLPDVLFIGFIFTIAQTVTAFLMGPELVAVAGSLASIFFYMVFRSRQKFQLKKLFIATLNYSILLALVLLTRLVALPWLKAPPFAFTVGYAGHEVVIDWLTTPGTLLLISTFCAGLLQKLPILVFLQLARQTIIKMKATVLTVILIVMLAKVMSVSGMIASTAGTLAAFSGRLFPFFAPILGALGTFLTGSDTSSNILFGDLQKQTALQTGFDPTWVAAANTSGATAGKMISPQSISVATSVVGIESQGRDIMRRNFLYCVIYLIPLSVYVLLVAIALR